MNKTIIDSTVTTTKTKRTPKVKATALVPSAAPATATTVPAVTVHRILTLADVATVPDGYVAPAYLGAFVTGLRGIASLPAKTRDERAIVATRFAAILDAAMPGTAAPVGRHTGRFTGMPVFEAQNTLFIAAALANVVLTCGHLMAAWRIELPNAKCDYLAKDYAWTTLSEYVNGRHNGTTIPEGVTIVVAWAKRNRMPLEVK